MSNHWQQDASATCSEHVRLLCGDPQGQSRMHPYQFNLIDSKSVETNADELCWEEKEACLSKIGSFSLLDCWIVGLWDLFFFCLADFSRPHLPLWPGPSCGAGGSFFWSSWSSWVQKRVESCLSLEKKHTWTYTNLETSWLISNLNLTENIFFCNAQRTFASSETHVGWTQKRECTKNSSLANGFSSASKCKMQQLRSAFWKLLERYSGTSVPSYWPISSDLYSQQMVFWRALGWIQQPWM